MAEMSRDEMSTYLAEINDRLANADKNGEIVMVGGAVVSLVHGERESTKDFDVAFQPKELMRDIIEEIAAKYELENDWMNNAAEAYMTPEMNYETFYEYSNLTVYNMDDESMLALKLASARDELTSHDMSDSVYFMKELGVESVEQVLNIVEKYIPEERLTPKVEYFAIEAFEKYQAEKDKNEDKDGVCKAEESATNETDEYDVDTDDNDDGYVTSSDWAD
jgi:predicted nucleotidyltransferase